VKKANQGSTATKQSGPGDVQEIGGRKGGELNLHMGALLAEIYCSESLLKMTLTTDGFTADKPAGQVPHCSIEQPSPMSAPSLSQQSIP
jgi:hypothetical protein